MAEEDAQLEFELVPVGVTPGGTEILGDLTDIARPAVADLAVDAPPADMPTDQKVERAIEGISKLIIDGRPLSVAYSGGKDSSVMMSLTLEAARRCKEAGHEIPPILVTHARTGIDNPAMDMVAQAEIERIHAYAVEQGLPVRVDIAEPALNDSWAVRIISGRALPTFANSSSRDCAISWKLIPQKRQRKAAMKELQAAGSPVVLVGTRFDESSGRAARMDDRGELDNEVWTQEIRDKDGTLKGSEDRLSPIAHWTQEDVWVFLAELMGGERTSYTDAQDIWDVYRDGGNSSCVVVADDTMKASSKACGARFGCALCAAVGRDKSLESMIESDPKYSYLLPLNKLQRFLVDTQYDLDRRLWLGRSIQDDGYIAIAPDVYSPAMQRELLRYAMTIDRDEAAAAGALGIKPRFQLVTPEQLLAIDAIWSMQGYQPRAFEAIHIWEDVYENGNSYYPPEVDTSGFSKKIPKPKWLYIGQWEDCEDFDRTYSGARHLVADLVGATEAGGCMSNTTLSDGRVVMNMEQSDMLSVDGEGAIDFLYFEAAESRVHDRYANAVPSEAFRYYQMLGVISTNRRHLGTIDEMLRRTSWKEQHQIFGLSTEELLARSVTDAERKAGLKAPQGMRTYGEDMAEQVQEWRDERAATAWRPAA
jgi:3'-phosphoadenosine 5'-phosphosulfate sulfotransferase (PAPS reductase)/FAD synthetase